jgi:hypothetical protein
MSRALSAHQIGASDELDPQLINFLAVIAGIGLAFQVGHFLEHAVQFAVWLSGTYDWIATNFCGRDTPFMSTPVTDAVALVGGHLLPDATRARQMMVGMELLHLVGNGIFLATIGVVYYLIPSKWVRYALYIEGAHLCEHLSLTLTACYLGIPIGVSTAFGRARSLWGAEAAVGYRVSWHFFMNLFPMPLVMMGIMQHWLQAAREKRAASVPLQPSHS